MNNQLTGDRIHELKIYPEFFSAVCTGAKRAELRINDRDYRVGDVLHMFEYSKTTGRTGEYINVNVTHVADVSEWLAGYALVSFELQERRKADSKSGDFLSCMRDELYQLQARRKGLCAFIGSPSFRALGDSARAAQIRQLDVMSEYVEILHYRIRLAEED